MPRPLPPAQTNAGDPRQVQSAERIREQRDRLERDDLIVALKSPQCRRVLWRVLEQATLFSDVWTPDALELAHRAGRQSVGRFLWAAIDDVDDQAVLQMRAEARARARRELELLESARTLSADEQDDRP